MPVSALLEAMHDFGPKEKQGGRIIDPEQKEDNEQEGTIQPAVYGQSGDIVTEQMFGHLPEDGQDQATDTRVAPRRAPLRQITIEARHSDEHNTEGKQIGKEKPVGDDGGHIKFSQTRGIEHQQP